MKKLLLISLAVFTTVSILTSCGGNATENATENATANCTENCTVNCTGNATEVVKDTTAKN